MFSTGKDMTKKIGTNGADTLTGGAGADELFGGPGKDLLIGNGGNDYLDGGSGDDDLRGGAGNDIYIVDNVGDITRSLSDAGNDDRVAAFVSYVLGPNQENLFLQGKTALNGTGNAGDNQLIGNVGANVLMGLAGKDTLDGHGGADDLRGGAGNDIYIIDSDGDIHKTVRDDGVDQVNSSINYVLGSFQENLVLFGSRAVAGSGNAGRNFLRGNDLANVFHGLGGNDQLEGGKGNDQLFGDAGDDVLLGQAGADVMHGGEGDDGLDGSDGNDVLFGDAGKDALVGGAGLDELHGGEGDDQLYGLDGADTLNGDAGKDNLSGGKGDDILFGGDGDDFLRGDEGVDHLHGGAGNDIYEIDSALELDTTELDAGLADTVGVNFDYTLGANQENLFFYGTGTHHVGTGNAQNNELTGTDAAVDELFGGDGNDYLDGKGGIDILHGGKGNDIYVINAEAEINKIDPDDGNDTVRVNFDYTLGANQENISFYGPGTHHVGTGNAGANQLIGTDAAVDDLSGGDGDDYLEGKGGVDILHVGNGNDTYVIDSEGELSKTDLDPNGLLGDTVGVNFDYTLGANQEHLFFYGTRTHNNGTGNEFANQLTGTDAAVDELFGLAGNDTLNGGAGDDHLVGGEGNDIYFVDNAGDIDGTDLDPDIDQVNSTITYTLLAEQEYLVLLPSATPINGSGNGGANIIWGNAGVNVLHGELGNDEIDGFGGADSLFGDAGDDLLFYRPLVAHIDGGANEVGGDTLFLKGTGGNITLDLTTLANDIVIGIEKIEFASNLSAPGEAHTLTLNANDLLALSDTTDIVKVLGESDDTVNLTGGGWSKDVGINGLFQGYTNTTGGAHIDIDLDILAANVHLT